MTIIVLLKLLSGKRSISYDRTNFGNQNGLPGKEIDCLLVDGERVTPVEVKSGKTMSISYFENLKYWLSLATLPEETGYVVYGGEQSMQTGAGALISWRNLDRLPD